MAEPSPQPPAPDDSRHAPPAPRPRRRRLTRAFVSLAILLLLCELILRFVFGLARPLLYQQDADCGYLPKPNQHIYRFFCHNDINADGMRSSPVISPKPGNEFRLLMLGDSVLYGMTHVDQSKIATSILANELPAQLHRPVEVLNASAGGWAPENEVGYVRSRGTFNADMVIFVLNGYDLLQPFNDEVPGVALQLPVHNPPLALWEAWDRYLKPRLFNISSADRGATAPVVSDPDAIANQTLRSLNEARQLATAHGAKFAVVFSPVVDRDSKPVADSQKALQRLTQWAAGAGVPLLDLSSPDAALPGSEVFYDGIHLNPPGQAIMAHAIEQWAVVRQFANPAAK